MQAQLTTAPNSNGSDETGFRLALTHGGLECQCLGMNATTRDTCWLTGALGNVCCPTSHLSILSPSVWFGSKCATCLSAFPCRCSFAVGNRRRRWWSAAHHRTPPVGCLCSHCITQRSGGSRGDAPGGVAPCGIATRRQLRPQGLWPSRPPRRKHDKRWSGPAPVRSTARA